MDLQIKSIGRPPEAHADRIVALMMKELAQRQHNLRETIYEIIEASSDGNPKAQQRMVKRLEAATGMRAVLKTGKRGRYEIIFMDTFIAWDAMLNKKIMPEDFMPEKPWLACMALTIAGEGRGNVDFRGTPSLLVTHHALSRAAQRLGARTLEDVEFLMKLFHEKAMMFIMKIGFNQALEASPSEGWRVSLDNEGICRMILCRHTDKNQRAMVVATVIDTSS